MNASDTREFKPSVHTLTHRILKRIRECEKYGIDVDTYVPKRDMEDIIGILDCCLDYKHSPNIVRVKK